MNNSRATGDANVKMLIGVAAVAFSILYLVSDLIELVQGGFSTPQLALTYAAEAAISLFVLGLYAVQRPHIGSLGLLGAVLYAYTFVFFTGTVTYALVNHTSTWDVLKTQFGAWMTVHSAVMVVAGVMFGVAVARAKVLPAWTGFTLIAGMVLIAASAGLPDAAQTAAAGVRDLAFAGMGAGLLLDRRHSETRTDMLTTLHSAGYVRAAAPTPLSRSPRYPL